jgi:hypothetical protein
MAAYRIVGSAIVDLGCGFFHYRIAVSLYGSEYVKEEITPKVLIKMYSYS